VRDNVAADAATSGYSYPQRRVEPIGDRGTARVSDLGGKPLELIDENLVPLSDHVFRLLDPYPPNPDVPPAPPHCRRAVLGGAPGLPLEW